MTVSDYRDIYSILRNFGWALAISGADVVFCSGAGFTELCGKITNSKISNPLLEVAGNCRVTIWIEAAKGNTISLICEILRGGKSLISGFALSPGKIKPDKVEQVMLLAVKTARADFEDKYKAF
jgi:hypothetical protein